MCNGSILETNRDPKTGVKFLDRIWGQRFTDFFATQLGFKSMVSQIGLRGKCRQSFCHRAFCKYHDQGRALQRYIVSSSIFGAFYDPKNRVLQSHIFVTDSRHCSYGAPVASNNVNTHNPKKTNITSLTNVTKDRLHVPALHTSPYPALTPSHPLPPPKPRSHPPMMLAGQVMCAGSPAHIIAIGGDGGRFNLTST